MSIFFPNNITPINELKIINKNGQEEKLDDEELNNDEYTLDDNNDKNNVSDTDKQQNQTQDSPADSETTSTQQSEDYPSPEDLKEPEPEDGESEFDNEENDNASEFDSLDAEENSEGDAGEEETNPEGGNEGDTGAEESPADDSSEFDNMNGDETGENPEDTTSGEDTSTDTTNSPDGVNSELQDAENQIFSDLTPEQLQIRIKELKNDYFELYKSLTPIIDRVNNIPKITKNVKVIEYILNNLNKLQEMIPYYLNNTFDTKTYIENDINYQQYLVVISTINKILKQISSKTDNNDE